MRALMGTLGRVGVVAVAAILIAGCLAAPVAAEQRPEAKEANDFIDYCFRAGGDPVVIESAGDYTTIMCDDLPGVGDMICYFEGVTRDCFIQESSTPGGGIRPTQPVDGVFVEEEPAPVPPQAVYEVVPIWSLSENDGGTEAPLRAAGESSGRVTILGGSAVAPTDEASGSRVTLGESSTGLVTVLAPAPLTGEVTLPIEETDAEITFQGLTLPVEETDAEVTTETWEGTPPVEDTDAPVTTQPAPGEGTLPVEDTDAPVTTEQWVGTLPVEETDAEVTTETWEGTLPVEDPGAPITTEPAPGEGALPVEDTDAEVTTDPVPAADEQP